MENELKIFTEGKVTVGEREFTRLMGGFGDNKPCISVKQIALLFNSKDKVINQTINRNMQHFINNNCIINIKNLLIKSNSLNRILQHQGYTLQSIVNSKNIYLLSHEGFLLYLQITDVKMDYSQFEKQYFGYTFLKTINPMRHESGFGVLLNKVFINICKFIPQYSCCNNNYRIDFYEPNLNLAIEYDEEQHTYSKGADLERELDIVNELGCDFIRVDKRQELNGINKIFTYILNKNNKLIEEIA